VVAKAHVGFLSGLLASRFRLSVGTPRSLRPEAPPRKLLKEKGEIIDDQYDVSGTAEAVGCFVFLCEPPQSNHY